MIARLRENPRVSASNGSVVAFGMADWICLAAAPTFAVMAPPRDEGQD